MESYCVNREGIRLFCRVEGKGIPVLLIHGSIVDCDFFKEVSHYLSHSFRVISYDRRGYSRSDPGKSYSLFTQAQDAADILHSFARNEKVIIVGCSMGALIALRLAAACPELVSQTILHEPPILSYEGITTPDEEQLLNQIRLQAEGGHYKSALITFFQLSSRHSYERTREFPPEKIDQHMKNGLIFTQHECLHQFSENQTCILNQTAGQRIRCLVGISSGSTFAVRATERLAKELNQRLLYVAGGHNAAHDHPEEFAAMLTGLVILSKE